MTESFSVMNPDEILKALRESKYVWRTAAGVARESGLPRPLVEKFLESSNEVGMKKSGSGVTRYALVSRAGSQRTKGLSRKLHQPSKTPLKCLVLLPRAEQGESVREVIFDVLRKNGIMPISFEERIQAGALWVDGILTSLRASDFLIADVTGRNPNVLFELGIAHGLGKPFLLVVSDQSDSDMPSDLLGYQFIAYDAVASHGTSRFRDKLERFVGHLISRLKGSL